MVKIDMDCKWRIWKIKAKLFKMCKPWLSSFNKNFYNRPKPIGNHGNMPSFYTYTQEKKFKVIGDKSGET